MTAPVDSPSETVRARPSLGARFRRHLSIPAFWRGGFAIAIFFLAWQLAAASGLKGIGQIPTPVQVVTTFINEYAGDPRFWSAWRVSFARVLYGFLIAQVLGIPLGILLGTHRLFRDLVYPVFELLRPIPPLAWVPLSILFWPTAETSIVFITTIGAFFIIVLNVYEGVRQIPERYFWLASSLGARRHHLFWRIMLPSIAPSIVTGMILGIAVTWNVLIAAEMIAGDTGLGRLTWEGYVSGSPAVVVIGMISIGVAGYLSSAMVHAVERWLTPWSRGRAR
ncbi:MAG TPA: ABC transporter permease [Nitrobacter sp.]|nr:ABC transporter permease [Nitrobacter sp.]